MLFNIRCSVYNQYIIFNRCGFIASAIALSLDMYNMLKTNIRKCLLHDLESSIFNAYVPNNVAIVFKLDIVQDMLNIVYKSDHGIEHIKC